MSRGRVVVVFLGAAGGGGRGGRGGGESRVAVESGGVSGSLLAPARVRLRPVEVADDEDVAVFDAAAGLVAELDEGRVCVDTDADDSTAGVDEREVRVDEAADDEDEDTTVAEEDIACVDE